MQPKTFVISALFFAFLLLNIISSQTVSKLFYDLSKGKREAAVEFLQKTRKQAYFPYFYSQNSGFFQEDLTDSVYEDVLTREEKIKELQDLLRLNPGARDAYYNLYILYLQEGEDETAQEYLKMARELDPEVK